MNQTWPNLLQAPFTAQQRIKLLSAARERRIFRAPEQQPQQKEVRFILNYQLLAVFLGHVSYVTVDTMPQSIPHWDCWRPHHRDAFRIFTNDTKQNGWRGVCLGTVPDMNFRGWVAPTSPQFQAIPASVHPAGRRVCSVPHLPLKMRLSLRVVPYQAWAKKIFKVDADFGLWKNQQLAKLANAEFR